MNQQTIQQALLIIADISGYTEFMVASDLEIRHSQHVISELMRAIIRQVEIPLEIAKLEGDAVFLYAKRESDAFGWDEVRTITGRKLIRFFDVFRAKLLELEKKSTCNCGACSNVGILRLKIVAHSGEALFYRLHDFNELSGRDVILVHRLLKNSLGSDEYLMLTDSAYRDIEFPSALSVEESRETYSHLGQITTYVHRPVIH